MTALNSEGLEKAWRFDIQYGPDGEANYAWVYKGKDLVATMRTHHADSIVEAMNRRAPVSSLSGEAEVVAWIRSDDLQEPPERRHVTAWEKVATSWAEGFHPCTPLVTLAALQAMQARAEKAEKERGRAKMQAKACSYRIRYQREQLRRLQPKDRLERPKWLANFSIGQHINKLHSLRRGEAARAEAAEARVKVLEDALEPFATHLDEMKFDLDNKGNELPDELAVGWVYVTNGDFRRARTALKGGSNG